MILNQKLIFADSEEGECPLGGCPISPNGATCCRESKCQADREDGELGESTAVVKILTRPLTVLTVRRVVS